MTADLFRELKEDVERRGVVVVVGADVSLRATADASCASWKGLLEHGADRAAQIDAAFRAHRYRLVVQEIASGDRDNMLSAAAKIERALGAPSGPEFRRWLRESVGSLKIVDRELLSVLRDLKAPLATTNYDALLEATTGLRALTWRDGVAVERFGRGDEPGIFHLFGFWQRPDTVLLGVGRCDHASLGDHTDAVARAFRFKRSILLVGCQSGVIDPRFEALRPVLGGAEAGSGRRVFRLVPNSGFGSADAASPSDDGGLSIGYGDRLPDLVELLRRLAPRNSVSPPASATSAASPQSLGEPAALPSRPLCLGREVETAELVDEVLRPAPRCVSVIGPAGVGKSTVVLEALHDSHVAAQYGPRRFFVPCDGARLAEDLCLRVGRHLGIRASWQMETAVMALLSAEPCVLVIDHPEQAWKDDAERVEALIDRLGSVPGIALIVTWSGDERPFVSAWTLSIRLQRVTPRIARQIFLTIAGERFASDAHLDRLLAAVDGSPLAIGILAHWAESEPQVGPLLEQWKATRSALLQKANGAARCTHAGISLEALLASARLTPEAGRLLAVLARLPEGVAEPDLDEVADGGNGAGARLLRKLGVLCRDEVRSRLLAPLRTHMLGRAGYFDEVLGPASTFYAGLVAQGIPKLGRSDGRIAARRLAPEAGNIEVVIERGLSGAKPEEAARTAVAWGEYVCQTGLGTKAPLAAAARVMLAASASLSRQCGARAADIALSRGHSEEARAGYEQALADCRTASDRVGEADCLIGLGRIAAQRSRDDIASEEFENARRIYREIGVALGEAHALRALGDLALRRSQYEAAHERYSEALTLYRQIGFAAGEAQTIQSLGSMALERSKTQDAGERRELARELLEEAAKRFEQAVPILSEVGDARGEAECLRQMANLAIRRSDLGEARVRAERALALFREGGDVGGEANALRVLARIDNLQSNDDDACRRYERAMSLYQQLSDSRGEAHCAQSLGHMALQRRQYPNARRWYEQALPVYQQIGPTLGEANCIQCLGSLSLLDGKHEAALEQYEQALRLYRQVSDALGEANCLRGLGEVAAASSDRAQARERYREALAVYERLAEHYSVGGACVLLARIAQSDDERAELVTQARSAWEQVGRADLLLILEAEFGVECVPA